MQSDQSQQLEIAEFKNCQDEWPEAIYEELSHEPKHHEIDAESDQFLAPSSIHIIKTPLNVQNSAKHGQNGEEKNFMQLSQEIWQRIFRLFDWKELTLNIVKVNRSMARLVCLGRVHMPREWEFLQPPAEFVSMAPVLVDTFTVRIPLEYDKSSNALIVKHGTVHKINTLARQIQFIVSLSPSMRPTIYTSRCEITFVTEVGISEGYTEQVSLGVNSFVETLTELIWALTQASWLRSDVLGSARQDCNAQKARGLEVDIRNDAVDCCSDFKSKFQTCMQLYSAGLTIQRSLIEYFKDQQSKYMRLNRIKKTLDPHNRMRSCFGDLYSCTDKGDTPFIFTQAFQEDLSLVAQEKYWTKMKCLISKQCLIKASKLRYLEAFDFLGQPNLTTGAILDTSNNEGEGVWHVWQNLKRLFWASAMPPILKEIERCALDIDSSSKAVYKIGCSILVPNLKTLCFYVMKSREFDVKQFANSTLRLSQTTCSRDCVNVVQQDLKNITLYGCNVEVEVDLNAFAKLESQFQLEHPPFKMDAVTEESLVEVLSTVWENHIACRRDDDLDGLPWMPKSTLLLPRTVKLVLNFISKCYIRAQDYYSEILTSNLVSEPSAALEANAVYESKELQTPYAQAHPEKCKDKRTQSCEYVSMKRCRIDIDFVSKDPTNEDPIQHHHDHNDVKLDLHSQKIVGPSSLTRTASLCYWLMSMLLNAKCVQLNDLIFRFRHHYVVNDNTLGRIDVNKNTMYLVKGDNSMHRDGGLHERGTDYHKMSDFEVVNVLAWIPSLHELDISACNELTVYSLFALFARCLLADKQWKHHMQFGGPTPKVSKLKKLALPQHLTSVYPLIDWISKLTHVCTSI